MYKRILVPLDGSDTAKRGLNEAIQLARSLGASLQLLHVVADLQWVVDPVMIGDPLSWTRELHTHGDQLLASAAKTCAAAGLVAQTRMRDAAGYSVGKVIVDEVGASACDVIVMGTHGRKGFGRMLMGSDAATVVQTSPVPVLLLRADTAVA